MGVPSLARIHEHLAPTHGAELVYYGVGVSPSPTGRAVRLDRVSTGSDSFVLRRVPDRAPVLWTGWGLPIWAAQAGTGMDRRGPVAHPAYLVEHCDPRGALCEWSGTGLGAWHEGARCPARCPQSYAVHADRHAR